MSLALSRNGCTQHPQPCEQGPRGIPGQRLWFAKSWQRPPERRTRGSTLMSSSFCVMYVFSLLRSSSLLQYFITQSDFCHTLYENCTPSSLPWFSIHIGLMAWSISCSFDSLCSSFVYPLCCEFPHTVRLWVLSKTFNLRLAFCPVTLYVISWWWPVF